MGTSKKSKGRLGSSFESWLEEEGILDDCTAVAIKRVIARQIGEAMESEKISKRAMASRMRTSRASLDRLLDPEHDSVTLRTLVKAASVLGMRLQVQLVAMS